MDCSDYEEPTAACSSTAAAAERHRPSPRLLVASAAFCRHSSTASGGCPLQPMMPPSPRQPDSMSLLLSSSRSMSAYASSSLVRVRPPPLPLTEPPPRRRDPRPQRRRPSKRTSRLGWLWLLAPLALVLILGLLLLLWLAVFRSPSSSNSSSQSSSAFPAPSDYRISLLNSPAVNGLLPQQIHLGRTLRFRLPGLENATRHLLYSELTVPEDGLLSLNISLPSSARIVIFARNGQRPSLGLHDWMRVLAADKLHLTGTGGSRQALVSQFVQAGNWHLGMLNDRTEAESILFEANLERRARPGACQFDCFGKGQCRGGRCVCHPGYTGPFCEETICPLLCSGNGVFGGGSCHCNEGFRGLECEWPIGWCSDCTGHGHCLPGGQCACQPGWSGEDCAQRECPGPGCAGNGICVEGRCFCASGWTGLGCQLRVEMPAENGHRSKGGECSANCSEHGHCLAGMCRCERGWTGTDCGRRACPLDCTRHGLCSADGICQCVEGWTGEGCQIELCANNCSGGGQCSLSAEGWQCQCDPHHFGEHCQFRRERSCDDGEDNDEDGLTDCEDSAECCAHSACSSEPLCLSGPPLREQLLSSSLAESQLSFYQRFRFLFEGDLAQQKYADSRLLSPRRLAVLRGRVLSSKGGPLAGVRISDSNNPHHGFSLSKAGDEEALGQFELAVNGGGPVTLQFVRQPYGRVLRTFPFVPWNRILDLGSVWMDLDPVSSPPSANSSSSSLRPLSALCFHSLAKIPRPILFAPFSSQSALPPFPGHRPSARLALDSRVVSLAVPIRDGHFLLYSSNRAQATHSQLRIQLTGAEVPEGLVKVHVTIQMAGTKTQKVFTAKPMLEFGFSWDRRNAFGQREIGLVEGLASVGLELAQCARPSIFWQHFPFRLAATATPGLSDSSLWSLSPVHHLQPNLGLLEMGDGSNRLLWSESPLVMLDTVLGNGQRRAKGAAHCSNEGVDCAVVLSAVSLASPTALAAGPDGSLFVGDGDWLLGVFPDSEGTFSHSHLDRLFQLEPSDWEHPFHLAADPFSPSLYLSLPLRGELWRLELEGEQRKRAILVDRRTGFSFPKGMAFDPQGLLLLLDGRRLLALARDGSTRILVEQRDWRPLPDCSRIAPLDELVLEWPTSLAVDPLGGQIFLLDSASVVLRLDLMLRTVFVVVGAQKGCAKQSEAPMEAIAFGPLHGELYIAQTDGKRVNLVKSISSASSFSPHSERTIAGGTRAAGCGGEECDRLTDEEKGLLANPRALAVLPNGDLLIGDEGNAKVKRMGRPRLLETEGEAEGRKAIRVNGPERAEQFEFDEQGRHVRTRALAGGGGMTIREMEYGEQGQLEAIREGRREIRVRRGEGGRWALVDEAGRELLRVEKDQQQQEGGEQPPSKISGPGMTTPIWLHFAPGQLLREAFWAGGTEGALFDYDPRTGLPKSVQFPGGGRQMTLEGPRLEGTGLWLSRVGPASGNDQSQWELEQRVADEGGGAQATALSLLQSSPAGRKVLFSLSRAASGPFPTVSGSHQLSVPALSLLWKLDRSALNQSPFRRSWELTLLRQRLSIRDSLLQGSPPMSLEWRRHLRRGQQQQQSRTGGGGSVQLNGRNLFSVDFDQTQLADSITDSFENELLRVEYGQWGHVKRVKLPSGAELQLEGLEGKGTRRRTLRADGCEWLEERDWLGRSVERFVRCGKGQKRGIGRRKLEEQKDGSWKVTLLSGAAFTWRSNSSGALTLLTPSGEMHSVHRLPCLLADASRLLVHSLRASADQERAKLSWAEARDQDGRWQKRWTGRSHWLQRATGQFGRATEQRQANHSLAIRTEQDDGGRVFLVRSPLFERHCAFAGPLLRSSNFSSATLLSSPLTFLFNWTGGDQLFRPAAVGLRSGHGPVDWTEFQFGQDGKLVRRGQSRFEHSPGGRSSIIHGESLRIELRLDQLGRTTSLHYFVPANVTEPVLRAEFDYHPCGQWQRGEWTLGERSWREEREMDENGQVTASRVVGHKEWRVEYGMDLRPKRIDGVPLRLGPGGLPLGLGELAYQTENGSGWTQSRGKTHFLYDGGGQLVGSRTEGGAGPGAEYIYDEIGRLVGRRTGASGWTSVHYGEPMDPHQPTHFGENPDPSLLWRIHWTDFGLGGCDQQGWPFLMQSPTGETFPLVPDPDNSVRVVLQSATEGVRAAHWLLYSPTGAQLPVDRSVYPLLPPLGFRSQLFDPDTNISFFRPSAVHSQSASRPFDPVIGRFMSYHLEEEAAVDWLRPELLADPFGLWRNEQDCWEKGPAQSIEGQILLPKPFFAVGANSPFGIPIIGLQKGIGIYELEKVADEVIASERVRSVWTSAAEWEADSRRIPPFSSASADGMNSESEERNETIVLVKNGTDKIGHTVAKRGGMEFTTLMRGLLEGAKQLEDEDLLEYTSRGIISLHKEQHWFPGDRGLVEKYVARMRRAGSKTLVAIDVGGRIVHIGGAHWTSPIRIAYGAV